METRVVAEYKAKVLTEISVDMSNGYNYLFIYGEHINGYFCCVPNWKWSCEMAEPDNVSYNAKSLVNAGVEYEVANGIANTLNDYFLDKGMSF